MVKERGKEVNISKYITTDQKEPMEREKEKKKAKYLFKIIVEHFPAKDSL